MVGIIGTIVIFTVGFLVGALAIQKIKSE